MFTLGAARGERALFSFYYGALLETKRTLTGVRSECCCFHRRRMHSPFCVRLTDHECVPLSSLLPVASLIIPETGRTLGDAARGVQEASGLPGQRTGRDF